MPTQQALLLSSFTGGETEGVFLAQDYSLVGGRVEIQTEADRLQSRLELAHLAPQPQGALRFTLLLS